MAELDHLLQLTWAAMETPAGDYQAYWMGKMTVLFNRYLGIVYS